MAVKKQFVVFLKSKEGALAKLTRELNREKLNLVAFNAPEFTGHGIIRFLVDEPARARRILDRGKYHYAVDDVVTVAMGKSPGGLATIAKKLATAGININYVYGSARDDKAGALLVFGVNDPKVADQLLN